MPTRSDEGSWRTAGGGGCQVTAEAAASASGSFRALRGAGTGQAVQSLYPAEWCLEQLG